MKRLLGVISLIVASSFAEIAAAETCISPYIKGLTQPEKVMYIWMGAASGVEDYLAVVDVNIASPTYGKLLRTVGVGSRDNEAHHMGFTDDRTKIWAAGLKSNRQFIFDVATDPATPRLIRTIDNVAATTGLTGSHTPYAIPGRVLISMASGPDGTGPGGLAEFTNEGEFIASHPATNNVYEPVIKPEFNRMITSSWVPYTTYLQTFDKWDPKTFSNTLLVWNLKERKVIQELPGDAIPLAARWMRKPNADYGYSASLVGNSLWMFRMARDGTFSYRKAGDAGNGCAIADLRQSPDDKYLYLSCLAGSQVQAWDLSDPENIKLHDTVQGLVQALMLHVTYDGRRLYVTNGGADWLDYSKRYSLNLIHIGPDGRMKLDPFFHIDFSKEPYGPARPHDMLLN